MARKQDGLVASMKIEVSLKMRFPSLLPFLDRTFPSIEKDRDIITTKGLAAYFVLFVCFVLRVMRCFKNGY